MVSSSLEPSLAMLFVSCGRSKMEHWCAVSPSSTSGSFLPSYRDVVVSSSGASCAAASAAGGGRPILADTGASLSADADAYLSVLLRWPLPRTLVLHSVAPAVTTSLDGSCGDHFSSINWRPPGFQGLRSSGRIFPGGGLQSSQSIINLLSY